MTVPVFVEDYYVYPRLIDLAACVCEEITASDLDPVGFCGVLPGGPVALEACNMAWTRLVTSFPSTQFPIQNVQLSCIPDLAFQIEVGITRCVPVHADGSPLTASEQLTLVRLQTADMSAMLRAIRCCMNSHDPKDDDFEYLVQTYLPIPQQGGVYGGTWLVMVTQGIKPHV